MWRSTVLLALGMILTTSPAFAQGLGESPVMMIFSFVALVAFVLFVAVSKRWALWCGLVIWGIGLLVNAPIFLTYLVGSAIVLPIAFLLRWLVKKARPSSKD